MDNADRKLREEYAAALNGAETIQGMGYLELQSTVSAIRGKLTGNEIPLDQRKPLLDSLVLAEMRMQALAGTDGSYAEQDQQAKTQEVVEGYLQDGNMKAVLQMKQSLEANGQGLPAMNIVKDKQADKAWLDKLNAVKEERWPILADQLDLDEDAAKEFFDHYESHAYGKPPPIKVVLDEPAPETPARPEGMESTLPDGDAS